MQFTNTRSNRHIFVPQDSGSPKNGLFAHVSGLGPIARLDFERYDSSFEFLPSKKGGEAMADENATIKAEIPLDDEGYAEPIPF